jgi:hypothetical protein
MAFLAANWNTVAANKAGNAPSIYTYQTADAMSVVRASAYFNALATILRVGDIIFCYTATGGTPVMQIAYVISNSSGVVDVTDGTVIAATNT